MLALSLAMGVVGLLLCATALRGRRIDDVPLCRRCGFDLTGIASGRCPECGVDLSRRRSRRWGRRRIRWWALAAGLVLGVPGATWTGIQGWKSAGYEDLPSFALVWLAEGRAGDSRVAPAFGVLSERLTTLSDARVTHLIELLAEELESGAAWSPESYEFVDLALLRNRVSPAAGALLVQAMMEHRTTVRARVRQGRVLPIECHLDFSGPPGIVWNYCIIAHLQDVTIDGRSVDGIGDVMLVSFGPGGGYGRRQEFGSLPKYIGAPALTERTYGAASLTHTADLAPGEHVLETRWLIELVRTRTGLQSFPPSHSPESTWLSAHSVRFVVVPADEPTVELMEGGFDADITCQLDVGLLESWLPTLYSGRVWHAPGDVPFAFDVFLANGSVEAFIGQITSEAPIGGEHQVGRGYSDPRASFRIMADLGRREDVRLILRPNLDLAESTLTLERILGCEVEVVVREDDAGE